jgi:hypothetical protein
MSRDELAAKVNYSASLIAMIESGKDDPPLLYILLDEGVLHRPVAPDDVMRAQFLHLAEMSRRPNITVQVVRYTAGGHPGLLGAFIVAEMGDLPAIVFLEECAAHHLIHAHCLSRIGGGTSPARVHSRR